MLDSGFEHFILESNHSAGDTFHEYSFLQQVLGSLSVSAQPNIALVADAIAIGDGSGNPTQVLGTYFDRSVLKAFQFGGLIPSMTSK